MTPKPGLHHCSGISMEDTYLLAMRCPVYRRRDPDPGFRTELEVGDGKGKGTSGDPTRVPRRRPGSDCPIVVMKRGNARGAKGAGHSRRDRKVNGQPEEPRVSTEGGSLQGVAESTSGCPMRYAVTPRLGRDSRVGPGSFTPSLSQNRT